MRTPGSLGDGLRRTILRRQRDREGDRDEQRRAQRAGDGPLRHFRVGRRAVLQSLATGVGAVVFASRASAEHVHQVAAVAATPRARDDGHRGARGCCSSIATPSTRWRCLSEQIVPGSRAAEVPEFLDRLLAVESTDTQKRFMQALGAFEREAREAHGMPWKALTAEQATALLTKISAQPDSDATRQAFERIKGAVAETYLLDRGRHERTRLERQRGVRAAQRLRLKKNNGIKKGIPVMKHCRLLLLSLLGFFATSAAHAERTVQRAVVLEDRRLAPRIHSRKASRRSVTSASCTTSTSSGPRTPLASSRTRSSRSTRW